MATMSKNKIEDLKLKEKNITSDLLIINQSGEKKKEKVENIRMLSYDELGSSNSRNRALENSLGDICLIADDDVIYKENYEKIVLDSFQKNPDADIITFQIETPEGKKFKENYMGKEQWHNMRTILKCASIEIAFKKEKIDSKELKFDTDFGLGSKYRVHDEVIFLADALKKGLKIKYIPIPIVLHPAESSGTDYNQHLIKSKGAAFMMIFGGKGFLVNIAFALVKYYGYKDKFNFFKFIYLINKGSIEFLKSKKKEKKWRK